MFRNTRVSAILGSILIAGVLLAACAPAATPAATVTPSTSAATTSVPTTAAPTTAVPTATSPTTGGAPSATAPDWAQLGFPTVVATQDITPGQAVTITAGAFTVQVPADAFSVPVKFESLTGDVARFLANAPSGEQPVLDFAFRVTNTQTGQ